jgi:hypothetical protein
MLLTMSATTTSRSTCCLDGTVRGGIFRRWQCVASSEVRLRFTELTPEATPITHARALYAFTVFSTLYRLRYLGSIIGSSDQMDMRSWSGMLLFDKDKYDRMRAALDDVETGAERMWLAILRIIKSGHGSVLIGGMEMHSEEQNQRTRLINSLGDMYRRQWSTNHTSLPRVNCNV